MATIVVGKSDGYWRAIYDDRQIVASRCKACVVNAVKAVTQFSDKYTTLLVLNEDGSRKAIPIGAANAADTGKTEKAE